MDCRPSLALKAGVRSSGAHACCCPMLPILLVLLLPWLPALAQPTPGTTDTELLLGFKASFSNGAEVLTSWDNTTDVCSGAWLGIACSDGGSVLVIDLKGYGLQGTIPAEGWLLPETLLTLDLGDNVLTGTLPNITLPAGLESLFLDGVNMLSGTIPEDWALPESLINLFLGGGNNFSGTLPMKLPLPPKLQKLQVGSPLLGGTISPSWKLPDNFTRLYMYGTRVSGTFPEDWQLPASLEKLWSYNGNLTGTLPFRLALPPKLNDIRLQSNNMDGTIKADWLLPDTIQWVDIAANRLRGTIPAGLRLPPGMNKVAADGNNGISVYNNQLEGPLPTWPGMENASFYVKPGNDGLCGPVPRSPSYMIYDTTNYVHTPLLSLPACPTGVYPSQDSSGSNTNTGAIVGGVVGGVAALALVCGAVWFWRRRNSAASKLHGADMASGKAAAVTVGSTGKPTAGPGSPNEKDNSSGRDSSNTVPGTPPLPHAMNSRGGLADKDPLINSIISQLSSANTSTKTRSGQHGGSGSEGSNSLSTQSSRLLGVDVKLWLVNFLDLDLQEQIGRGSFGRVYFAHWKGATKVAVKLLLGEAEDESDSEKAAELALSLSNPVMANLQKEAQMMAALRHPNVLGFLGVCTAPPCLLLEYCPRGSLFGVLKEARESEELQKELHWPRRLEMALGVASGVLYLHSFNPPFIHRDLRSPNILLASDWTVKVSDFNLSKILGEVSAQRSAAVTNPRWLPPEVLKGEGHTFASDVFSFGVILYELLTFRVPWEELDNPWQIFKAVSEGQSLDIPPLEELPGGTFSGLEQYIELMKKCQARDPQERPSFGDVVGELRRLLVLAGGRAGEEAGEEGGEKAPAGSE